MVKRLTSGRGEKPHSHWTSGCVEPNSWYGCSEEQSVATKPHFTIVQISQIYVYALNTCLRSILILLRGWLQLIILILV